MAFLKKVHAEGDDHDYFGDVKKLITETFVRQLYLKREKIVVETGGGEKFEYSWGARANLEFPKKDILDTVAEVEFWILFNENGSVLIHFDISDDGKTRFRVHEAA